MSGDRGLSFVVALGAAMLLEGVALADPPPAVAPAPAPAPTDPVRALDPDRVQSVVRPGVEPGEAGRTFASGLLFVPRKTVELLFLASGLAAGLVRDEQVVPRVEELISPRDGELTLFPTLFVDSRQRPSAGVRMLARGGATATSFSLGFGGVHDVNTETRFRIATPRPIPLVLDLEGMYDMRSKLEFLGVGQDPEHDKRNDFRAGNLTHDALYLEQRSRAIASLGARFGDDFQLFASTSYTLSRVFDTPGETASSLDQVFVPGTVVGSSGATHLLYTELALRFDTRATLGRPSPGVLLEGYSGYARETAADESHFIRVGGRAAGFIRVLRRSNIFSLKLAVDGLFPLQGERVPFTSLVDQPDFRGFNTRRDDLSVVASLDYRWSLMRYMGARLFVDAATVADEPKDLLKEPPRWAGGFGFDIYSDSAELGQLAVSFTDEGVRLLLSFGVPQGFGDRQHRY